MAYVRKRSHKDGNVSYQITVSAGTLSSGKKVRKFMTYTPPAGTAPTKADKLATRTAFEFEANLEAGYCADYNPYFRDYAEYVMNLKKKSGLKQSTYERYLSMLPEINAGIGHLRLKDIRPAHLNTFYDELAKPGARHCTQTAAATKDIALILKRQKLSKNALSKLVGCSPSTISTVCQRKPISKKTAEGIAAALGRNYSELFHTIANKDVLSNKTILEFHRLIGSILSVAEKEMIVTYNAARKATPPKREAVEINYFQPDQISDILAALDCEPTKWQAIVHLFMLTGCRRGEIVGLKWSKIDFEKKSVRIDSSLLYSQKIGFYESSTKTGNVRFIPLPKETLDILIKHRSEQKALQLMMGESWHKSNFVFTRDDGQPLRPDSITAWLSDFSDRHALPHINPHAFRHTAASIMISHGTDVVTVSKLLGHAKVSTTEDIYSHLIDESKQLASNVLAEVYYKKA